MATDHIKATFVAIIDALRNSAALRDKLTDVWPFYAYNYPGANNEVGRLTIYAVVGDTQAEDPLTNESTYTDVLPTTYTLICDTRVADDAGLYINDAGYSLLDLEFAVLTALQESAYWGAHANHMGWTVSEIRRDVAVQAQGGGVDPDTRRFEIDLLVKTMIDRTDGPAR